MNQLDLFARHPLPVRRTDPPTSEAAAASIAAALPQLEQEVLDALRRRGPRGGTSRELADELRRDLVTVSPRLRPLANRGLVRETSETRPGPSGRPSVVWRAT